MTWKGRNTKYSCLHFEYYCGIWLRRTK